MSTTDFASDPHARYLKDGKVAVIYSPGYGAGWSTWSSEYAETLLMDARIVAALLERGEDWARQVAKDLCPGAYVSRQKLCIAWLPAGTRFEIAEYDGFEALRIFETLPGFTA